MFHTVVAATALSIAAALSPVAAALAQDAASPPVSAPDMDALFAELAQVEGEGWAAAESDILREWSRSGSPVADLLLKRGYGALDAGDTVGAIGHLTALVEHAPDFAPGWAARAEAKARSTSASVDTGSVAMGAPVIGEVRVKVSAFGEATTRAARRRARAGSTTKVAVGSSSGSAMISDVITSR